MKYEEIYKKIMAECTIMSHSIENIEYMCKSHEYWVKLGKLKESIVNLGEYLFQFNKKIVEDGGSTI